MRYLQFAFLCEGRLDLPLKEYVEDLAVESGVFEVFAFAPDFDRLGDLQHASVRSRLQALVDLGDPFDLVVVHRDADSRSRDERQDEVSEAAEACGLAGRVLALVPVQETEAWLLADEEAIRTVVGNPSGRDPLDLPALHEIEGRADPKEILLNALVRAAHNTPVHRQRVRKGFSDLRRSLLEQLRSDGRHAQLSAHRKFRDDLGAWVATED